MLRIGVLSKGFVLFVAGLFLLSASVVWAGAIELPKTGQTTSYATGDDGDLEKGVVWPSPRFTNNGDGTVTDNLTGLVWLKNANCFEGRDWSTALNDCNTLNSGECGLSDGSVEGDWRLPNKKELVSITDDGQYDPALPSDHLFTNLHSSYYWSGTSFVGDTVRAWYVSLGNSYVYFNNKSNTFFVWPVRGPDSDADGIDDHEDNCPNTCNSQQLDADDDDIGDVCDSDPGCGGCGGLDPCEEPC